MVADICWRTATADDYAFARHVHHRAMRPHVERLFGWDSATQADLFRRDFSLNGAKVIRRDGRDVGWLQVLEDDDSIYLRQLFILPEHQNQGVGTAVLKRLQADWADSTKTVTLGVLRCNPARRLYERHGFTLLREEPHRLVLHWNRNC